MRLLTYTLEASLFIILKLASALPDDIGLANGDEDVVGSAAASASALSGLEAEDTAGTDKAPTLRGPRRTKGRLFDDLDETKTGADASLSDIHEPNSRYPKLVLAREDSHVIDGEYLVVLDESVADVEQMMNKLVEVVNKKHPGTEATGFGSLWNINDSFKGQAVRMSRDQAGAMSQLNGVQYIEQNMRLVQTKSPSTVPSSKGGNLVQFEVNNDECRDFPWNLDRIDQGKVRNKDLDCKYEPNHNFTGEGVLAFILDEGIDGSHEDFADDSGRSSRVITNILIPDDQLDCTKDEDKGDGTFVAAIVGGKTSGVAKKVQLVNIRASKCSQGRDDEESDNGEILTRNYLIDVFVHIANVVTEKRIVVNGSIRIPCDTEGSALTKAITKMIQKNIVFVVEAGDKEAKSGEDKCNFPANLDETITVGATEWNQEKSNPDWFWEGTNLGSIDIFAPGAGIKSAKKNSGNGYEKKSGTSYAAAHVTGAVALILEEFPDLSSAAVKQKLICRSTSSGVIQNIPDLPTLDTPNRLLHVWTEGVCP